MANHSKKFGPLRTPFVAELDTDVEGDGKVTGCWIICGVYSASLEYLLANGELGAPDCDVAGLAVPDDIIESIEAWALGLGY